MKHPDLINDPTYINLVGKMLQYVNIGNITLPPALQAAGAVATKTTLPVPGTLEDEAQRNHLIRIFEQLLEDTGKAMSDQLGYPDAWKSAEYAEGCEKVISVVRSIVSSEHAFSGFLPTQKDLVRALASMGKDPEELGYSYCHVHLTMLVVPHPSLKQPKILTVMHANQLKREPGAKKVKIEATEKWSTPWQPTEGELKDGESAA